jgi:hypothetical protein
MREAETLALGLEGRARHLPKTIEGIPSFWHPPLPSDVPQCEVCTLPCLDRLCAGCKKLFNAFPTPAVVSFEFAAIGTKREPPEGFAWAWKEYADAGGIKNTCSRSTPMNLAPMPAGSRPARTAPPFSRQPQADAAALCSLRLLSTPWRAPLRDRVNRRSGQGYCSETKRARRLTR